MNVEITDDFEVIELGVVEDYVYDVEVEDTHTFFGNNILIHNSCYLVLDEWVKHVAGDKYDNLTQEQITNLIDAFCKNELEPYIEQCYNEIAEYSNARSNKMNMKREVISTAAMWRSKKNYIMYIIDNEGIRYATPQLKMMGVEVARAATPQFIKDALKDCYVILLNGTEKEFIDYLSKFKKEYFNKPYEEIAFSLGVNNIEKWVECVDDKGFTVPKSGTPWNVKAAMAFNNGLVRYEIADIVPITSGNKIKLLNITEPNPYSNNAIGYSDYIPDEFNIEEYVDYNSMYNKTFLKPITSFSDLLNWKTKRTLSVDSLF